MVDQPIGPGTLLAGRFRLEDLLDENDGARFWRATDRILARNVAVHVIPREDRRSDALLVAARTSATVSDGHLLRVLDAAEEDGVTYVVNEWGHGMSLDRILADGPLSPRRAAWVVKEVAEAISTAHRSGIAHGRLVPENVMVTEAGSVKLIGFVVDAVLRGRDQLRGPDGSPLDEHESDVINLAALLYACLTGRWPGVGDSTLTAAPFEHGHPLRPRQVRAGVPRPLDAVCDRVLNPGSHGHAPPIESAHEIYAALADYVGDVNGSAVGYGATTLLDEEEHEAAVSEGGPPTQMHPAPSQQAPADPEPTRESAAPVAGPTVPTGTGDPAPTEAGMPVFYDEDTGVGWTTGTSRGLRSDEADPLARRTPPPPPPPFPEPEERPLFAPDPPAGTPARRGSHAADQTTSHPRRSTGPGAGPLPSSWGPDATEPAAGGGGDDWRTGSWDEKRRPGSSWLRLAALVGGLIVLVVAVVFAFNLGRGSDTPSETASGGASPSGGTSAAASKPVEVVSASDFDPESDTPEENPELVPLALDGKPGTAWETMTYYGRPDLGGLKSGVGLLLDLGKPTDVSTVKVTLQGSPTSLSLLAAPDGAAAPTSTDGLTTVDSVDGAGTTATLKADKPVKTQYLVVWLTKVPPASGGFQGRIAEINVRS